jgi:hypothetical protein
MKNFFLTLILITILLIPNWAKAQTQIKAKSDPVSLNIRKKKLPPILEVTDIKFMDANNNNCIDGLEKCSINFTIANSGTGPAVNMLMKVENQPTIQGLVFNKQTSLSTIDPGAKLEVKIPVDGTISLATGAASFQITFEEQLGFPPDPIELKIDTREFQKPEVKIVDSKFITDNGTVTLGKSVQLQVLVQNTGQGVAENVMVKFGLPAQNVYPNTDELFPIGTLKPGDSRNISFEFLPNKIYKSSTITVNISITEKWEKYAQNKEVTATVGARTIGSAIIIAGNNPLTSFTITEASLSADVDKNIPETAMKRPHAYALIIGNEDYTRYQPGLSTESNVLFALNDARTFARYAENTLGLPKGNIFLLENAIGSEMNREIERLAKLIEIENGQAEVFVFYAGHGFPDETTHQSYIMPVDISGANVTSAISLGSLYSKLTRSPAKQVTVFLDACFSGAGREAGLLAARAVRIKPNEELVSGNLVVFSASRGDQMALPFREKQHGLFTYFLLKSLQETKGNITCNELFEKVKSEVTLNAVREQGKEQNPSVIFSPQVVDQWGTWTLLPK